MTYDEFLKKAELRLPQFSLIDPANMQLWYEKITSMEPGRIEWHLNRLANVGGSEIGVFVAESLGEPAPFNRTPTDVYRSKMMLDAPEATNEAMSFGTDREGDTRDLFTEMALAVGWRQADEALILFEERARSTECFGGLGYSPDDLFINTEGQLVIVDYKTPYRKDPEDAPLGYRAQLHQGGLIARTELGLSKNDPLIANGTPMLLVYGIHPESYVKTRTNELYLKSFDVDHDLKIEEIIKKTRASFFRDFVLKGQTPPIGGKPLSLGLANTIDSIVDQGNELANIRAQIDAINEEAKNKLAPMVKRVAELTESMSAQLIGSGENREEVIKEIKRASIPVTPAITNTLAVEIEEVKKFAKDHGIDIAPYIGIKTSKDMDSGLLIQALLEAKPETNPGDFFHKTEVADAASMIKSGAFPEDYFKSSVSWRASKAKMSDQKEVALAVEKSAFPSPQSTV